jgi:aspartate-semialdehyde dehydrogenase
MKVAVVGATGLVGTKLTQILEERNYPVTELIPVASARSVGKEISYAGKTFKVVSMDDAIAMRPDVALFSAGGGTSEEWAPKFAAVGCRVIDNSSAWRMSPDHKLIVPEINGNELTADDMIIANPNCSTIQLVMALKPLQDKYGLKRLVISTYQSITGTGVKAVKQMEDERNGADVDMCYPHKIDRNCIPHCDVFLENDYTKEEMKMVHETRKILGDDTIAVTATSVRVPVVGGHSEAVNIELHSDFDVNDVRQMLNDFPGVTVLDNPAENAYPMPLDAHESDEVFVGRIRRDDSQPNTLNMWIVSDNLRKGAATNTIQIAEHMISAGLLPQGIPA